MREILFRGKRIDNGEWVEGYLYITHSGDCEIGGYNAELDIERITYIVDHSTVGQYTGLKANGKRIFEGDILQFSYIGENKGVEGKESVVFKNGKFGVEWGWHRDFTCLDGFANTYIEVIGNIHDNPELMEAE